MIRTLGIAALAGALALGACGYGDRELMAQESAAPQAAAPAPAARPAPPPLPQTKIAAPAPAPQAETRTPFVVINFGGRAPQFAAPLYEALTGALARQPAVRFDLVAVTRDPDAAERNLDAVVRTMTAMGVPASRLTLAAAASEDDATDEVWIYVR